MKKGRFYSGLFPKGEEKAEFYGIIHPKEMIIMSLAELFSIIAVVISFIAVCISFLTFIDNKRQTKIMQKQLDEQLKPKFTDEPYNAYTAKLDRISRNLNDISNEIHNLSDFFNKE